MLQSAVPSRPKWPVPRAREASCPGALRFRAMGVLDDAIRQHLELKRKHGASDEELTRKEAEALGPARREVAPPAERGVESTQADPDATALRPQPAEPVEETHVEPPPADPEDDERLADDEVPATELLQDDLQPAGALNGHSEGGVAAEPEGEAPHAYDDELAAEEELVADGGVMAETAPPAGVLASEPEDEPALEEDAEDDLLHEEEPPHTSGFAADDLSEQETLEHDLPDDDTPAPAQSLPEIDDDALIDVEDEDFLEDTPEFLQETPEHDRLWFEQKPPRNFDFDN